MIELSSRTRYTDSDVAMDTKEFVAWRACLRTSPDAALLNTEREPFVTHNTRGRHFGDGGIFEKFTCIHDSRNKNAIGGCTTAGSKL
jgi:hypothetical protein